MKCPSCGHRNLSDFPFCEHCLALLPARPEAPAAAAPFGPPPPAGEPPGAADARAWPPFPWSPPDLANPLIGRDRALKELLAAARAVREGEVARIHLLVSEYGMGKSRLVDAFVEGVREEAPDAVIVRARCPAQGGPFRMWDALLRAAFGISREADAVEAGERLVEAIAEVQPDGAADVAAAIAFLTGYEVPGRPEPGPGVDAEALVGRATAATTRLLANLARERPLLLVLDHANRASARSLAVAGAIEASLKGRPGMLLLTGTPELQDILPGWDRFPVTALSPLGRADAERMLRLYLEGLDAPPKALVRRILDRAHGNPYALKAIVRYLRAAGAVQLAKGRWHLDESAVWDLELPDNLEGVVLAQVGTLPGDVRAVLARAAVIGDAFWLGALVALERLDAEAADEPGAILADGAPEHVRAALAHLERMRFVERRQSALAGEESWAFRSPVHWRVADAILPDGTKQRLHRVVWQWLRVHAAEAGPGVRELLARHAEAAGEPGEAARTLLAAALEALGGRDPADTRRLLEAAARLADADDFDTRLRVALALGDARALGGDGEGALAAYQEALQLAWRLRHRGHGGDALARIARVERSRGALDTAYGHFLQALRIFEGVDHRPGVASVCHGMGEVFWLRGDFEKAVRFFRKAEDLYRHLRDRRGLAESVHSIGALQYDRGDLTLAEEYLGDALALRQRIDDRRGVAQTLNTLGVVYCTRGELERAVGAWEEALDAAEEIGDRLLVAKLCDNLGEALRDMGRDAEARERLEAAVAAARATEQPRILVDAWCNLARLHASAGEWAEVAAALAGARREAAALGLPRTSALVDRTCGDTELARARAEGAAAGGAARGALAAAQASYRRAARTFEEGGYDLEAATARERLAEALAAAGDEDAADDERRAAARLRARRATRPAEA